MKIAQFGGLVTQVLSTFLLCHPQLSVPLLMLTKWLHQLQVSHPHTTFQGQKGGVLSLSLCSSLKGKPSLKPPSRLLHVTLWSKLHHTSFPEPITGKGNGITVISFDCQDSLPAPLLGWGGAQLFLSHKAFHKWTQSRFCKRMAVG